MVTLKDTYPLYLANRPWDLNRDLAVTNPYSGEVVTHVARADAATIESAIAASVSGFEAIRSWPPYKRKRVLAHVVDRLTEQRDTFTEVIAVEAGKPINDARGEVARAIDTFTLAAEESIRMYGEVQPLEISERAAGYEGFWKRVPAGPCSFISPWNFPLNLVAHKVAPALAVGCSFVLKPASATPVSALMLGEILSETDLPEGTFSILPCSRDAADALVEDDRFKHLSFTGSQEVGWQLKARAGRKPVTLELGGNAATIVDDSADLEVAAKRITRGAFYQSGQSCISVQRVLVHARVYDEFRDRFVSETATLKAGDPLDEDTFIGPIISEDDARRIETWINEAVSAGARILIGGTREGSIVMPTIVESAPTDARINCDEVFGPVATLAPFQTFAEAIAMVNGSDYGLQAGVFTDSLEHAHRAWCEIECGGVVINDSSSMRVDAMPYGGVKESGLGREGVRFAMEALTDVRLMVVKH